MTTHELLELAALDALGLLDDDERDAFEQAFQAAPPAIQAQVRREQARLARAEGLLPDVEAPAGLRARVLAAVRDAIHAVQSRRSPRAVLPLLPSRGVSAVWRAAAIGCAAAAVIFGFTTIHIRGQVAEINRMIEANAADTQWIREYGARFSQTLFDENTRLVNFARTAPAARDAADAKAALLVDGDGAAIFRTRDLPENPGGYALVSLNADGSIARTITTFDSVKYNERFAPTDFAPHAGRTLALIRNHADGLVLANTVLRSKAS